MKLDFVAFRLFGGFTLIAFIVSVNFPNIFNDLVIFSFASIGLIFLGVRVENIFQRFVK